MKTLLLKTLVVIVFRKICTILCLAFLTVPVSANSEMIDIRYKNKIPMIDAKIGNRWHSLIIDTGSSNGFHLYTSNIINNPNIKAFEIESLKASDLAGKTYNIRQWQAQKLMMSETTFSSINIVELVPWGLKLKDDDMSNPEDEVIGLGSFNGKIVSLNFINNKFEFDSSLPQVKARVVPFELSSSGIIVAVNVNDLILKFVVDTAATESVVFYDKLPAGVVYHGCDLIDKSAEKLDCNVVIAELIENSEIKEKIHSIAIGSNSVEGFGFDGVLGMNFLKKHNITINMNDRLLYIID